MQKRFSQRRVLFPGLDLPPLGVCGGFVRERLRLGGRWSFIRDVSAQALGQVCAAQRGGRWKPPGNPKPSRAPDVPPFFSSPRALSLEEKFLLYAHGATGLPRIILNNAQRAPKSFYLQVHFSHYSALIA